MNQTRRFNLFIFLIFCIFIYCIIFYYIIFKLLPSSSVFIFFLLFSIFILSTVRTIYQRLLINQDPIPCIDVPIDLGLEDPEEPEENFNSRNLQRLRLLTTDRDFNETDYEELLKLDDENEVKFLKGVSETETSRLPFIIIKNKDLHFLEKSCSICLDQFQIGDSMVTIPCFHQFHKECISKWLHEKANCPICDRNVFQQD